MNGEGTEKGEMGKKGKMGKKRVRPACLDPESEQYRKHRWIWWGADARFRRCRRCGLTEAIQVSNEARYGYGEVIVDRPLAHHHVYAVSPLDGRYERCACGASRQARKVGVA